MTNDALTRYDIRSYDSGFPPTALKRAAGVWVSYEEADLLISNLRAELAELKQESEDRFNAGANIARDKYALQAELEAERAKALGLEKDAARYRWLKSDQCYWLAVSAQPHGQAVYYGKPDGELDAAIDAARDEGERA